MEVIKVGLLGCGTVGSEVVRLLREQREEFSKQVGVPIELVGIAVKDLNRDRGNLPIDPSLMTDDALSLVRNTDIDILVEVIGGLEPVNSWLLEGLRAGRTVVTANKVLIAQEGAALQEAAVEGGVGLYYEAAVCSAIPLVRTIKESLQGDSIGRLVGIVNGTTNFILSLMETGVSLEAALKEAMACGYAEADPTADIEGFDAAAKAAILASLAFRTKVNAADVYREGISKLTLADIALAEKMGRTIKLLFVAERFGDAVNVRVHPALIPQSHMLASVNGPYNAVQLEAAAAGRLMFYGLGAGGAAAASAVLSDLLAAAQNRLTGARPSWQMVDAGLRISPINEVLTRYHIVLEIDDRGGAPGQIGAVFTEHGVSIEKVDQEVRDGCACLVIVTHIATESAIAATATRLRSVTWVRSVSSILRVEL